MPIYFFRCHQSYIVNLNKIATYEPYKLVLSNGAEIPVPPKKYGKIIKQYKAYLLTK
ncbi:MAG: LytTR family transcriptional regulator [Anaerotruncus sp.]|nr:MAG: LytTR family transcriptional regulator [Anaerotruncus sp.]